MANPDEMTADELRRFEEERVQGREDEPVELPASETERLRDDRPAPPQPALPMPPD